MMGRPTPSKHKSPLQSKKFLAFIVAEASWKIIIGIILALGMKNGSIDIMVGSIILACVLIAGFIEAAFIGGQASLDKYLGLAQIAAQSGHRLKGVEIIKHSKASEDPKC